MSTATYGALYQEFGVTFTVALVAAEFCVAELLPPRGTRIILRKMEVSTPSRVLVSTSTQVVTPQVAPTIIAWNPSSFYGSGFAAMGTRPTVLAIGYQHAPAFRLPSDWNMVVESISDQRLVVTATTAATVMEVAIYGLIMAAEVDLQQRLVL